MSDLKLIAEARADTPLSEWPEHNEFHRRNLHPFAGSRSGEMYWDEECLRCQLERVLSERLAKK